MPSMPTLFTASERGAVLEQLKAFAASSPAILGTLLVGSGAEGFRDRYADLDVVYVAEPHDYAAALEATTHFATTALHPIFCTRYQHRADVVVLCLLLKNRLEVDIGVWSAAS